ncbi:uncharacterized protein LOC114855860 [Betta splendens]|uniref:Uncharacterized protein LOC114855860 n=1 Tax=Betta splendens TaxID=158456 RepID=A0A9W2XT24_BETSP|nr:uncharacterized protein LOC114855860 [Betta splendens]
MKMTHQSSPAEIEVTCYYSVEQKGSLSISPLSNSIIIQTNAETQSVPAATVTTGETSDLSSSTVVSSSASSTASANAETQSVPAATVTTGETSDLSSSAAVHTSTTASAGEIFPGEKCLEKFKL